MSKQAEYFIKATQARAIVTNPDLLDIIDKALCLMAFALIGNGV